MSEGVNQPLVLRKKSRSSRFASWSGDANRFYDKMLRVFYIFLLQGFAERRLRVGNNADCRGIF